MNRTQSSASSSSSSLGSSSSTSASDTAFSSHIIPAAHTASRSSRHTLGFSIEPPVTTPAHSCFVPMHYESGYAYPLIVWLHGPGSNEEELPQVMPLISTRNHIAIAPRGTSSAGARRAQDNGPACTWEETTAGISEASERVEHCIALARQRYNVHPERVFIAGYSAGGTMAHRLAMQSPERFAGAISLGGQVPRGSHLLKHINRARQLPLLLSASPTAEKYPTEQVMADLRFLHCAGLTLSLRLYPEGDDLTTVMFQDLNTWVMEQFCTPSATASS